MSEFTYIPPASLAPFFMSNARVRAVRGPIGSTKTTAMIMELMRRAGQQAPGKDGIRRTRMAVVRNTMPQIKSTCLASINQILRPIVNFKVSESKVTFEFKDIHSEWMLLPLDTEQNIQRLLSLELTYGWVSEFREIDPNIVMSVLSRCGRYPSAMDGGATHYGVVMETNSFSEDSPWNEQLEVGLPSNWDYFVQPGARDPKADWLQYLPPDYYNDMVESNTPDWVEQYVDNKITPSLSGQAVYRNTFVSDFHIADNLVPIKTAPLIIGCDFARHPAAIIGQVDSRGRLLCFDELEQENCGVEKFVKESLMPLITSEKYAGIPSFIVGDPSGVSRGQIGEESVFDALKRMGFDAHPAQTNNIDPRIRAVEKWLLQQRDGKGAFLVDREGCPKLILGFQARYRYKIKKDGQMEPKPDKVRPWADLHDALQYLCLGTAQNILGRVMRRGQKREFVEPRAAGWT